MLQRAQTSPADLTYPTRDSTAIGALQFHQTFHGERLVRALDVKLLNEGVELPLLLEQIRAGGPGSLLLQRLRRSTPASGRIGR
jgi:hypothetical protein